MGVSVLIRKNGDPSKICIRIENYGKWQSRKGDNKVGLDLVKTLMPSRGAKLSRSRHDNKINTLLELEHPVLLMSNEGLQ